MDDIVKKYRTEGVVWYNYKYDLAFEVTLECHDNLIEDFYNSKNVSIIIHNNLTHATYKLPFITFIGKILNEEKEDWDCLKYDFIYSHPRNTPYDERLKHFVSGDENGGIGFFKFPKRRESDLKIMYNISKHRLGMGDIQTL